MFESLESRLLLSASVSNGTLTVTGTDRADQINITQNKQTILVREGSSITRFSKKDHISGLVVNALGGNDRIKITSRLNATVDGGDGNDLIISGSGNDLLLGGNGKDRILANAGNDSITGGAGRDTLFGGAGDDMLDAYDTQADQLTGGGGNDRARVDTNVDTAWNVEGYLEIESALSGVITGVSSSGTLAVNGSAVLSNASVTLGLGSGNSASNLTISSGAQTLDLNSGSSAASGFDSVRIYASDLYATRTLLYVVVRNASIDGGIIDPCLSCNGGTLYVSRIGDLNLDGHVDIYDFIDLADNSSITVNGTGEPVPQPPTSDPVVLIAPQDPAPLDPPPSDPNPAELPATVDPTDPLA
jgi:Ca2+-binding RTX toxin-like protein